METWTPSAPGQRPAVPKTGAVPAGDLDPHRGSRESAGRGPVGVQRKQLGFRRRQPNPSPKLRAAVRPFLARRGHIAGAAAATGLRRPPRTNDTNPHPHSSNNHTTSGRPPYGHGSRPALPILGIGYWPRLGSATRDQARRILGRAGLGTTGGLSARAWADPAGSPRCRPIRPSPGRARAR